MIRPRRKERRVTALFLVVICSLLAVLFLARIACSAKVEGMLDMNQHEVEQNARQDGVQVDQLVVNADTPPGLSTSGHGVRRSVVEKRAPKKKTACPVYPISTNGQCGSANGRGCPAPFCCSGTGFCGEGESWCGTGCQIGYGVCNSGTCSAGPATTKAASGAQTTRMVPTGTTSRTTTVVVARQTTQRRATTMTLEPGTAPRFEKQTEVGSYFTSWGIYGRNFKLKDFAAMAAADQVTFVNYAFGNLRQINGGYECGIINKPESGSGDGGDAWADFGRGFLADESVDGVRDEWDAKLAGNFNQLKVLKARFPKLKVLISLGGWTWSRWFSNAASTDALRKQLVSSCISVYIKGNLPVIDGRGGNGTAADIFDGIDIDWEYPGGGGLDYNTVSPNDKENFSKLLAEFRSQLSDLSMITKKPYGLTIAAGAGRDKIVNTNPATYSQYLDWISVMTYDYHGGWTPTGPTNFHSNLYPDPAAPDANQTPAKYYNTQTAIDTLIAGGAPADKIVLGVPFYGRGWTGVTAGSTNALYQSASGPGPGTFEQGFEDYKVLKNSAGTMYFNNVTQQSFKYDTTSRNWWSFDTPADIDRKVAFAKSRGLRGMFSWSLDGDTADGELLARTTLMKA